jgi:predicted MFS family arabinose efflux permease
VSSFAAPMIMGFTIDYAGHGAALLVLAAFTLLPIVVLSATGRYTTIAATPAKTEKRSALDLLRIPPLRRLIIMSGLMVAASDLFVFYVPVFAHSVGLSASTTGLIMGAYAAAMFSTRFAMPRLVMHWQPGQILFVAMGVSGLAFLAFPFFTVVHTLMALAFVIGLGLGCGQPLSMSMTYDRSPPGRTGETTGLRLTANNMARVVVPLVSGALGAAFGAAPVFWLCALNLFAISGLARSPKSN